MNILHRFLISIGVGLLVAPLGQADKPGKPPSPPQLAPLAWFDADDSLVGRAVLRNISYSAVEAVILQFGPYNPFVQLLADGTIYRPTGGAAFRDMSLSFSGTGCTGDIYSEDRVYSGYGIRYVGIANKDSSGHLHLFVFELTPYSERNFFVYSTRQGGVCHDLTNPRSIPDIGTLVATYNIEGMFTPPFYVR